MLTFAKFRHYLIFSSCSLMIPPRTPQSLIIAVALISLSATFNVFIIEMFPLIKSYWLWLSFPTLLSLCFYILHNYWSKFWRSLLLMVINISRGAYQPYRRQMLLYSQFYFSFPQGWQSWTVWVAQLTRKLHLKHTSD